MKVKFGAFPRKISNPVSLHPQNYRWFNRGGRAIPITGSYGHLNLMDSDEHGRFRWDDYIQLLLDNEHNHARLFMWGGPSNDNWVFSPDLWTRMSGKWNVENCNPAFLDRLEERVEDALHHGIYVTVMLFNDRFSNWGRHPFNGGNNANLINCGSDNVFYSNNQPVGVRDAQRRFIRRVVSRVDKYDNVLYEIANEAQHKHLPWVRETATYLRTQTNKPIIATSAWVDPIDIPHLVGLPTNVIAPHWEYGNRFNPDPVDDASVVYDADHSAFANWARSGLDDGHQIDHVIMSFLAGASPISIEPLQSPTAPGGYNNPPDNHRAFREGRRAMGYIMFWANRINLRNMKPTLNAASLRGKDEMLTAEHMLGELPFGWKVEAFNVKTGEITPGGSYNDGELLYAYDPTLDRSIPPEWVENGLPPVIEPPVEPPVEPPIDPPPGDDEMVTKGEMKALYNRAVYVKKRCEEVVDFQDPYYDPDDEVDVTDARLQKIANRGKAIHGIATALKDEN